MTQIFTPEGLCLPATVLALEEGNIVTQVQLADHNSPKNSRSTLYGDFMAADEDHYIGKVLDSNILQL